MAVILWILIVLVSLILVAVNYMIISSLMDVDYDDLPEAVFCFFLAIIGSVVVIPIVLLIIAVKPVLSGLDDLRDKVEDYRYNRRNNSKEERKEIREKKKKEKENTVKILKKEIVLLNKRIAELNKYRREEIIEV